MRRVFGLSLLGFALLLGGYGIYAVVKEDVQGGADAAGAILLAAAAIAALVGGFAFLGGRRRT
jgi:hypothetical protein